MSRKAAPTKGAKRPAGAKKPAAKPSGTKSSTSTSAVDTASLANALADIRTLADEMSQRSSFRVKWDDFHIMPDREIDEWEAVVREETGDATYTIPRELREVYRLTGGFELRWTCDADEGLFKGSIVLASLPELYQRDDESDTPMGTCMGTWRRLDTLSDTSSAAIRLDQGADGLRVRLVTKGKPGAPLMSITEYIVAAARHIGTAGWQINDTSKTESIVRALAAY